MFATVLLIQSLISGPNGCFLYLGYTFAAAYLFRRFKPRIQYHETARNAAYHLTDEQCYFLLHQFNHCESVDEKLTVLFEFMDKNDDGALCLDEISHFLMETGLTASSIKKTFEALDKDANEGLDQNEFCSSKLMQGVVKQLEMNITDLFMKRIGEAKPEAEKRPILLSPST